MDEAKEVHTNLRNAAGLFKFAKVLVSSLERNKMEIHSIH